MAAATGADSFFVKRGVAPAEHEAQQAAVALGIAAPRVLSYDPPTAVLTMERVAGDCLANAYGEEAGDLPPELWSSVRSLVAALRAGGLWYVDITAYNFMQDRAGRIWIVDFGHCRVGGPPDAFVDAFVSGHRAWNPDFR